MALANDFHSIGKQLVSDYEERLASIAELKDYVRRLLEQVSVDRTVATREMWDTLRKARLNRRNEVAELLNDYIQDRAKAEKSWAETLEILNKLRSR